MVFALSNCSICLRTGAKSQDTIKINIMRKKFRNESKRQIYQKLALSLVNFPKTKKEELTTLDRLHKGQYNNIVILRGWLPFFG